MVCPIACRIDPVKSQIKEMRRLLGETDDGYHDDKYAFPGDEAAKKKTHAAFLRIMKQLESGAADLVSLVNSKPPGMPHTLASMDATPDESARELVRRLAQMKKEFAWTMVKKR
jgi:hypothetical protein